MNSHAYIAMRGLSHIRKVETYSQRMLRLDAERREELRIVQRAISGFHNNVTPIKKVSKS